MLEVLRLWVQLNKSYTCKFIIISKFTVVYFLNKDESWAK